MNSRPGRRLALVALALIPLVLLLWAGPLSAQAALPSFSAEEWEILRLTNKHRLANSREPLSMIPKLQDIAHIRAGELVVLPDLQHFRPDGQKYRTVFPEVGLAYTTEAENIAVGQRDPATVISVWKNSAGHNRNLLNDVVYHVGCGYALGGEWGRNWVQDFMTYRCATTDLRVEVPRGLLTVGAGSNIESLGIKVVANCSKHGDSYMPLIGEMCSPFDFSRPGPHEITVSFDGFTAPLVLPFLLGDANLDRIVDARDAVALILYLVDGEVSLPRSPGQADMDGGNGLNMTDLELLIDLLLR